MKFPLNVPVYGDQKFRGSCPSEALEQVTFFARMRKQYPETWGKIAFHPRNEGERHHRQVAKQKAEGMVTGTPDIFIPGRPAFVCELKRRDHTKSVWQAGQEEYLLTAQQCGAFVCIALGVDAAMEAFYAYQKEAEGPHPTSGKEDH